MAEIGYEQSHVVEENGRVTAALHVYRFEQNIRGEWKLMGGIGDVASAPEARRRGQIRTLLGQVMESMQKDGMATSTLWPFKNPFYARFGYVTLPPNRRLEADPFMFSRWTLPRGYRVERLAFSPGIKQYSKVHEKAVQLIHGGVRRDDRRWQELEIANKDEIAIVYGPTGEPEAGMWYKTQGYGEIWTPDKPGTMSIIEAYWLNRNARAALFNYIYLHTDQLVVVRIPLSPRDEDYYLWVENFTKKTVLVRSTHTPMARIIDVEKCLHDLPASQKGRMAVKVRDAQCSWNSQAFQIECDGRVLAATQAGNTSTRTELSIEGLTALCYGSLDPNDLVEYGWLKLGSEDHIHLLRSWFPKQLPHLTEDF
jgi:predicted acetyltransferase